MVLASKAHLLKNQVKQEETKINNQVLPDRSIDYSSCYVIFDQSNDQK